MGEQISLIDKSYDENKKDESTKTLHISYNNKKEALLTLDEFIGTFESYAIKYDDEYGQRIIESIFYAFTSPFLYEIKRLSRTKEERHDIPQFLFIGGVAGSGKSI